MNNKEPLIIKVCVIDDDAPFIFHVNGMTTIDILKEIEMDVQENHEFKDDGEYTLKCTQFYGQIGFDGKWEIAPCWEWEVLSDERNNINRVEQTI